MFGFSFGELLVISLVTLVAVGPQKLPGMLKTMGQWARKLRKMTMDVRRETGIDEMLRAEGIQISELRSLMRGYHPTAASAPSAAPTPSASPSPSPRYDDPYGGFEPDPTREYPPEGADAYGALPDDLLEPPTSNEVAAAPGAPEPKPEPVVEAPPAPEPVAAAAPEPEPVIAAAPEPAPAPVVAAPEPVVAAPAPVVAAPVAPPPASSPASAPPRSAPPPPPSRTGLAAPRPSGTPPPPPRRTAPPPPRPDSSAPVKADAPAVPPSPGTPNGNG